MTEFQHKQIGPYRIEGELGRGGMGVVYRARQPDLDREVAVKVMLGGEHAGEEAYNRFVREARAAGRLRHPNIVAVHDVGVHEGLPYIVMDFVPGRSLAEILATQETPVRQGVEWVRDVAHALDHAHEQGVIHRDIKPGNILIDAESGRAMLTDFGLAREVGAAKGLTQSGATLGTPAYMSPEQAAGTKVDQRTDIYGLGAVLYEVLTGRPPFEGDTPYAVLGKVLKTEPTSVRSLTSHVSRDVELICHTAMAKERERRYPTAAALAEDCERWVRGEAISARAPSMLYLLSRRARRAKGPLIATAVSLLLTAILVFVLAVWPQWKATAADRAALRQALAAKQAIEREYVDLLHASRADEAIAQFRERIGQFHPVPELNDRKRAEEPEFAALHTPYQIDLPAAYLARGLERLARQDGRANGDLASAYHLGRDLPGSQASARAALVTLGTTLIREDHMEEARPVVALAVQTFGSEHATVRALVARLDQREGRVERAAHLWHSVRSDPLLQEEAQSELELLETLLPFSELPDPGEGYALFDAGPGLPLSAARVSPEWVLSVRRLVDGRWTEPTTLALTAPDNVEASFAQPIDLDGDGRVELLVQGMTRQPSGTTVTVCHADGDGWRVGNTGSIGFRVRGFRAGDLNGDGMTDLIGHGGREFCCLLGGSDRFAPGGIWNTFNYIEHTSIRPNGDVLVWTGPFLLSMGWPSAWQLGVDGTWLDTPEGRREPQQLDMRPDRPWGYRVFRLRHDGAGWLTEVETVEGRYAWGHAEALEGDDIILVSRAGLEHRKVLPGVRSGSYRCRDVDGHTTTPVPFGDPDHERFFGAGGWFDYPIGGVRHAATYSRGVLRVVPLEDGAERITGLEKGFAAHQLDADPARELVWRDVKAGTMRVGGVGTFTPGDPGPLTIEAGDSAVLREGLEPEEQLFDAGLYAELAQVCRERLASGGGPYWQYTLGRALSAQELWAEAAEAFDAATGDVVLEPEALLRRGHALERLRDWKALQTNYERLAASRHADPFARELATLRAAWAAPAAAMEPRLEWTDWTNAPPLVASTALKSVLNEGRLFMTWTQGESDGVGALVKLDGGPFRLTVRVRAGRIHDGAAWHFGVQRLPEGAAYDQEGIAGLWCRFITRGSNDIPAVAWRCEGRARNAAWGNATSEFEVWEPKPGEEFDVVMDYVPGFNRAYAEFRAPDGTVLLTLPPAQLAAPLEPGVYLVGAPVIPDAPGKAGRWPWFVSAELGALRLEGGAGIAAGSLAAATPRLAYHLANGRLLVGDLDGAGLLFRQVEDLSEGLEAEANAEVRARAALARAVLLWNTERRTAAHQAAAEALQLGGERLQQLLVWPRAEALSHDTRVFLATALQIPLAAMVAPQR